MFLNFERSGQMNLVLDGEIHIFFVGEFLVNIPRTHCVKSQCNPWKLSNRSVSVSTSLYLISNSI